MKTVACRMVLILLTCLSCGGCGSLGYYGQAVGGQMEIWRAQRPNDEVIADPATTPAVRDKLGLVKELLCLQRMSWIFR